MLQTYPIIPQGFHVTNLSTKPKLVCQSSRSQCALFGENIKLDLMGDGNPLEG
jgi:hypothetical protein